MKFLLPVLIVPIILTLLGCAGKLSSISNFLNYEKRWQSSQVENVVATARDLETKGELSMAVRRWQLIQQIGNPQAEKEIRRLTAEIAIRVDTHYHLAMKKLKNKELPAARNALLTALRLDPTFEPALKQLKVHFSSFPLNTYRTVPGDNPASVAKKVFNDEKKAFLVVWFNDWFRDETFLPGTMLILPKLSKTLTKTTSIRKAVKLLDRPGTKQPEENGDASIHIAFDPMAKVVPRTLDRPEKNTEADKICYRAALAHVDQKQFIEARSLMEEIDENQEGVIALKKSVYNGLEKQAKDYYRNGVKHFIEEDLQSAISDWEKTLLCDPNHKKALGNIENARRLMQKIEALP